MMAREAIWCLSSFVLVSCFFKRAVYIFLVAVVNDLGDVVL